MKTNESSMDRGIRAVLGIALIVAALATGQTGAVKIAVGAVGGIALLTGLVGVCPLYALLGINTCPRRPTG